MRERWLKMKVILQLLIKCQCCPHIELAFSGFRNTEADQTKGVPSLKKHVGKHQGLGSFSVKLLKKLELLFCYIPRRSSNVDFFLGILRVFQNTNLKINFSCSLKAPFHSWFFWSLQQKFLKFSIASGYWTL